jgi:two-component system, OmpR family, sensor kinase
VIRKVLLVLSPVFLCLVTTIALELLVPELPILNLHIDIGIPLLMFGLGLTIAAALVWLYDIFSRIRVQSAMEKERALQSESKFRFLRQLDHELKNPLTGIRAAIANLDESDSKETLQATLPDIRRQVDRMVRLTADLRKLATLEEITLEQSEVSIGNLLTATIDSLRVQSIDPPREVRLTIPQIPWPLPPIVGDSDLLGLAFHNLIQNAIKYTRPEDVIEVRAAEHGHSIQIEIADSGPGIPPTELPRIFEDLYRGSNARGVEGSGIGLALVKRIVERHGGRITVRSQMNGSTGTLFVVQFPTNQSA